MDPESPTARKVNESLRTSLSEATSSVELGVDVLTRLREQGGRLRHTNDRLTPISALSEQSGRVMSSIMSGMSSGRRLFYVLALVTVILLWLVIRWKSAK
jgi:hypothetical protein